MAVESWAQTLIKRGKACGTSDIHILPEQEEYVVYFRLSGKLYAQERLTVEYGERVLTYFKFIAQMDVGERRRPQSGAIAYKLAGATQDLRLSTIANYLGQESLVIRLLSENSSSRRNVQTFFDDEWRKVKRFLEYKSGLILFSGPVDSGKTTAMYHLVQNKMGSHKQQVISIEDPVEIKEPEFLQVQVNEKSGVTYEALLKATLRHHPDVIIVGEIRDEETARMVMRGALTGHLILASVHARDAYGVLARLSELGVSEDIMQQTLIGIVFQKLLPLYCPLCGGNCSPHCRRYAPELKRAALLEVLSRAEIGAYLSAFKKKEQAQRAHQRTFNHLLKKVYAYGFIEEETLAQFYIP